MPLFVPLFINFIAAQVRPVINSTTNFLSWGPRVAVARLAAKWRSLITIVVGVILGAGIGALVPLYSNAVGQIGMIQRLADEPAADAHSQLRISLKPSAFENVDEQVAFVGDFLAASVETHLGTPVLGDWVDKINPYVRTAKMGLIDQEDEPIESTRASVVYIENWENEVRLVEGTIPSQTEVPDDVDFNVAVPLMVASELEIRSGDRLTVDQRLDNQGNQNPGAHASTRPFVVNVSAIFAPEDDESPFWMALDAQENPLEIAEGGLWQREIYLFATEAVALDVATNYVPDTDALFGWRLIFDHSNLSYTHIDQARQGLRDLEQELFASLNRDIDTDLGYRYYTRLVEYNITNPDTDRGILQDYARKQRVNNVPFALLLCQVGGLVVFFLMVTAALVRRSERREIAMLQSRGASDGHILALRGVEALIITIFGAAVAPFLAQRLLILLGPTIANTSDFPLPLTSSVFIYSSVAAGITFVALMATLYPVLRLPLISAGGAALRSQKNPWFQTYYVDIILSVVGLALLAMLLSRDSPLIETNLGEQRVDFFLLAAPLFLLLGLGSFALRLFPVAAHGVSILSSRRRGLLNSLATWQLSREPIHYGRITFLLALAIGIGWFATSFRATVRRSQDDQASYLVGTDVRLYERDVALRAERSQDLQFYLDHPDVDAASIAHRVRGVSFANSEGLQRLDLLAIDPKTFGDVAIESWRSDLGNIVVPYGPSAEVDIPEVGSALPFAPTKIGMWVRLDRVLNPTAQNAYVPDLTTLSRRVSLSVRLQDEAGTWIVAPFEISRYEYNRRGADEPGLSAAAYVTTGWAYYEADLSAINYDAVGETRLVSLFWEYRAGSVNGERRVRLLLGDMSLFEEDGIVTPYDMTQVGNWEFVDDIGARSESNANDLIVATDPGFDLGPHGNIYSITFDQLALWSRMGINLNYVQPGPLEAVVSESLAELIGLDVDTTQGTSQQANETVNLTLDNVHRVPVTLRTRRTTEYFPTLFNERRPFAIVDSRELLYAVNHRPSATIYGDEAWLSLSESVQSVDDYDAVLRDLSEGDSARFRQIDEVTYAQEFDQLETDPLALGLLGLMFLAFIIALALSIVGLLTYSALTAQARRGEFGVLRALGLPAGRVVWSLLLEQLFVVVVASLLGAALGFVLSEAVVPTLALGTTGEGVVPPFLTQTEWGAIGNFALIMAGVLLTVFATSLFLVRQMSLSRTLRLGDE